MKYLKKFNEELKPGTYFSAARKLTKLGDPGRAAGLKDWGDKIEMRENLIKWKENLQTYAPFGIFKLNIVNPNNNKKLTGDFALDFNFDPDSFSDNYECEKEENPDNIKGLYINFFLGLIPTSEELLQQCEEVMPAPEMSNGFYWGMCCSIEFDIINGVINFKELSVGDYDYNLSGKITIADRPSAGRFKMVLKNLFSNPGYNYPSSRTDCTSQWEALERTILVECGLSSEYGFELEQVANFINTISPNTLYKP
jgi:hypothetical protein